MSDTTEYQKEPGKGKIFAGLILLVIGVVFLLQQVNFFFFPHWLFRWPMWLIIWGLFAGAKHNFRNSTWLILILVGLAFLADDAFPGHDVGNIIWPVAIIIFGLWLILRRNHQADAGTWEKRWENKWNSHKYNFGTQYNPGVNPVTPVDAAANPQQGPDAVPPVGNPLKGDDFLDCVSIFGGVKKTILSKNFMGGEIVNIFGGAELDLTMADINGRVIIDITQIFGGTKIIVPANWQVVSDIAAVFAGVDDKRIRVAASLDSNKVLVLKGVSIFAGVDIRSY